MHRLNPLSHPAVRYARALLALRLAALADTRRQRDLGASAIELAVITAILVLLAVGVVAVIHAIVTTQCNNIQTNAGGGGGKCP
jgi:Flp pilus assembly pilin Flp